MSAEGRCPSGVVAAGFAPLAARALTQQARAAAQAQWRGVQPPESTLSTSPPTSIRIVNTFENKSESIRMNNQSYIYLKQSTTNKKTGVCRTFFSRAGLSIGNSNLEFAKDNPLLRAPSSRSGFNEPRSSYSVAGLTAHAYGDRQ